MQTVSLIFAAVCAFGAVGSILMLIHRVVSWGKGSIAGKVALIAVVGWVVNGVVQAVNFVLYYACYSNGFDVGMFSTAVILGCICCAGFIVSTLLNSK